MGRFLGSILHAVAQLLAGVFSVLFVVTAVLVMLLISVDQALLNADTYKRALAENGIYARIPSLAAEQLGAMEVFLSNPCADNPLICRIDGASPELQACLTAALGGEALVDIGSFKREPTEAELQLAQPCLDRYAGTAEEPEDSGGTGGAQMGFLNNLSPEDWEKLISTLLPPDEMQVMIEQSLDQAFGFLDGDVDSASVSLVALRERLVGPAGQEVIGLLLAAQPPCTDVQLEQLTMDVAEGEGDLVLCQPQAEDADALMFHMQERFDSLVAEMPDEAELIKPPSSSAPAVGGGPPGDDPSPAAPTNRGGPLGDDPLAALRLLRQWLWLSLLIPLGLLLVVTVFGVRSRKGWLRWWGIPMFVAGLLTTSLGIAAVPALDWVWLGYVAAHLPPMFSSSLSSVAHTLADSVVRELTQWILLGGGSVMLLGLAAIVGSFYVREGGQ